MEMLRSISGDLRTHLTSHMQYADVLCVVHIYMSYCYKPTDLYEKLLTAWIKNYIFCK
jgi:ribulose-5-phosphate 4-epimerase/fuculose-1-phosphate aldolase